MSKNLKDPKNTLDPRRITSHTHTKHARNSVHTNKLHSNTHAKLYHMCVTVVNLFIIQFFSMYVLERTVVKLTVDNAEKVV